MLILNEEVKNILASKAPLIIFFGLAEQQQIELILELKLERKYDFPDGDLITDNALEILVNDYNASLNSILIRLDEPIDDKAKELFESFNNLFSLTGFIDEKFGEDISNEIIFKLPEWNKLRSVSTIVRDTLNIRSEVNINMMRSCIEYWQHP